MEIAESTGDTAPPISPSVRSPPETGVYVISDADGFLVGFYEKEEAVEFSLKSENPVIIQRFPLDPDGEPGTIYVIPYCEINATAFVTNSRDKAKSFQKDFNKVGLIPNDNVNFFQVEVGKPRKRFEIKTLADEEVEANRKIIERFMDMIRSDEKRTIEYVDKNFERVSIYDYVEMVCPDLPPHQVHAVTDVEPTEVEPTEDEPTEDEPTTDEPEKKGPAMEDNVGPLDPLDE